ncbi:MAG TPA: uroporphyrinogen-III C-methyltransferase [Smithellaceae bacterium]|jgi:uroporphyrinogen III methyltransferase/synthase|nr:uroporphyrinogen-III C-methyltransferase [Smithellaceae bacterium]HNV64032.1 uroporphyrinogen-III C-methyltransferase [Smithellaceae bacterium]HOF78491.1 uroporphyrinogen-III C-methyltransferase [Smithellaceae bacterium]HOZ60725.1 uroporphyrinogen-III C-methyltransferase [Smithellaceae bacterium]HPD49980.1 uroporphyrinogen-III C-methyltransferase [Smithellaceae bacterium]
MTDQKTKTGKVYIIGAGPGDAGLITLKAVEALLAVDVVVYDNLVNEELLKFAPSQAKFIYAGKKGGDHTLSQDRINELLVKEARAGNTVARLKGGDPFIFGRGGEEAQILAENNIEFEIIPGVTSAIAVPAYAGIPLTHRGFTSTVAFVTGHEDPTKEKSDIDWSALAKIGTLVFLMGVKNLPQITKELIKNGKAPETPVALIRNGSLPTQQVLVGMLSNIVILAHANDFRPPAILVVGGVVDLRDTLRWFDNKPLFGLGVVITRPERQADDLARLLLEQGANPISFPTIAIEPPDDWGELDKALKQLESYHWLIFTSANGVRFFFERLRQKEKDIRDLKGRKICCIGPATARQIEEKDIKVDMVPDEFIAEGILKSFSALDVRGKRFLLPRAAKARDILPEGLKKMGAMVDVVKTYRTVNSGRKKEEFMTLLEARAVDVITFTSSSTVEKFVEIMGKDFVVPPQVRVACIGPVTASTAKKAGFQVDIEQKEYTMQGLVQALIDYNKQMLS